MPPQDLLAKYAHVAVNVGLGLGVGDRLIITAPTTTLDFTRLVVQEAYRAGAVNVDVLWDDEETSLARFTDGPVEASESVTGYSQLLRAAADTGDFSLKVVAENPYLFAGQPPERVSTFQQVNRDHHREFDVLRRRFHTQWAVVAVSVPSWATSVFPELEPDDAVEELWRAIFRTCRINEEDPVRAWTDHCQNLQARADVLNAKQFDAIRYVGPGTDLTLGLPARHVWHGGATRATSGRSFVPNLPTEEVFAAPHRMRGHGVVSCTKPLILANTPVTDLVVTVRDGRVVDATASQGQTILSRTLESDEGSVRFGEIALVPHSGAVARERLVWNNVLYDENDGCHIAFGQSYAIGLEHGPTLSEEALKEAGMNQSSIHIDFTIGSADLEIYGVHSDGSEEPVMVNGEWAFAN